MKKALLVFVLVFSFSFGQAQDDPANFEPMHNELKTNMTNLIIFKWVDFGYERILNEESSIGVSVLFSLDDDEYLNDELRKFSITPYYRHFFSNQYAKGFFVEGFAMLHSGSEEIYLEFDDDFADGFSNGFCDGFGFNLVGCFFRRP